jgi:hypothetical protein
VLGEQERAIKERKERYSAFNALFRRFTPAFAVFVFFVWGGVALAGISMPGDPLYGVKTTSENVREILLFDAEQGARFEEDRINRRLNEAQQLLERGRVSEKSVQELARELKTNLEDLRATLDTLEAEGERLLVFEIERGSRSSLEMYKDVFMKMSEDNEHARNFLNTIAPQFNFGDGFFAMNSEKSTVALDGEGRGGTEVNTLLLVPEESGDILSEDVQALSEPSEAQTMVATDSSEENENKESETFEAESSLDLETLKLYASVRRLETERQIKNARQIDSRLRDALLTRLEEAHLLYENGVFAEKSQDERGAHSLFLESLSTVEDVRPLLRMATNKPSELFITTILKKLEDNQVVEDPNILFEEEEVRGVRESNDEPDFLKRQEEVEVDNPAEGDSEEEGAMNLEEVRKLQSETEL